MELIELDVVDQAWGVIDEAEGMAKDIIRDIDNISMEPESQYAERIHFW